MTVLSTIMNIIPAMTLMMLNRTLSSDHKQADGPYVDSILCTTFLEAVEHRRITSHICFVLYS